MGKEERKEIEGREEGRNAGSEGEREGGRKEGREERPFLPASVSVSPVPLKAGGTSS